MAGDRVLNTGGVLNLRDADAFQIAYDQESKTYLISAPVAGSGTIMRTSEYKTFPYYIPTALPGFGADPSNKNPTEYCCETLSITAADQPLSRYSYVSFVDFFATSQVGPNLDTYAYGTFAVGQPTRPDEVPTSGSATYTGELLGHFAGDAGATWLEGDARFNFNFESATLTGDLTAYLRCMMGCSPDPIGYQFTNSNFARGSTMFSGQLIASSAPSSGTFSGLFAGPGAAELMAQFRLPYFNNQYEKWMAAGGAIAAKRN